MRAIRPLNSERETAPTTLVGLSLGHLMHNDNGATGELTLALTQKLTTSSAVSYEACARVLRWLRDSRVLHRPRYDPHLQ